MHHRIRLAQIPLAALACLWIEIAAPRAIAGPTGPTFTDAAVSAGVNYLQHTLTTPPGCILGFNGSFCEPERMTGGVAIGDYNNDGLDDIYVTRLRDSGLLFRSLGGGLYEDGTTSAGLTTVGNWNGAAWGDIDNDGDQDLYVTSVTAGGGRFFLHVNDGAGHFTEEAQARGAAVEDSNDHLGWSASFGDYNLDGYLDIFACEWGGGVGHARLLRNQGSANPGHFDDVTEDAGVEQVGINGAVFNFSTLFMDMDGDHWPDLACSGDFGTSRFFWNNGDGTFSDGTLEAGLGGEENGMGSTIGDWNGDGRPDWFVTSVFDPLHSCDTNPCNWGYTGNRLYRNEGNRKFSDVTSQMGVRMGFWGWGAAFLDYDNDGDLDTTMTNGVNFSSFVEVQYHNDPMRFWRNDGPDGPWAEISQTIGVTDTGSGKGLAVFDYENDGDIDIFVVDNASNPKLYRNDGGNANGWLRVRARGTQSNRDGLGAKVTLRATSGGPAQYREINNVSGYLAQSERVAHFGLGAGSDPVFEVRVFWPKSGAEQVFNNVTRNQTLLVVEP